MIIYRIFEYNFDTDSYKVVFWSERLSDCLMWFFEKFGKFVTSIIDNNVEYFLDFVTLAD